jgi:hypothetical protein
VTFTAPAGATYKICRYYSNCSATPTCYEATGNSVTFQPGGTYAFDYYLEVRYVSGQTCSSWTLDVDWSWCAE